MLPELFSCKQFQREDLARAALHPGFINAWATGLGKTIAAFLWPLLKVGYQRDALGDNRLVPLQPVLLIVPGDGHDQVDDESRLHFKTVATRLPDQQTFLRLSTLDPRLGTRSLPPAFYLTSFSQLTQNGVMKPDPGTPQQFLAGIGETRHGIKCVYDPTLVDLAQACFGAVVVDEGTKIQGNATLMGTGVRQLQAPYRMVMSATPIKNHFKQIFHLAHFVCGGGDAATPRFPFGRDDRAGFIRKFQVTEVSRTQGKTRRRTIPQVCNVHLAWKVLASILVRRRKEDCGEDVQPLHRHVVRVPLGLHQAAVYKAHLEADYRTEAGQLALGPKLQALRQAAANPASTRLQLPPGARGLARSPFAYVPKSASVLGLVRAALLRREQVLIGGAFEASLDALSERLDEAGVPHLILDGRSSQAKRGQLARLFKQGCPRGQLEGRTASHSEFPVLLAGVESMAELHSFRWCNNVILQSYSWAYDKFEQFPNRASRLNSPWPTNLWSVICDGSIDRRLEANVHEKRDAVELVLDGHLIGGAPAEVNLAELLQQAFTEFDLQSQQLVDERDLLEDWPKLRAALAEAYQAWPVRPRPSTLDLRLAPPVRLPLPPPMPLIGEPGRAPTPAPEPEPPDLPLWQAFLKPKF